MEPRHRLSPAVLDRLEALLTGRGIRHGDLVEGRPHLNHNLSDGARVFVKVTRAAEPSERFAAEIVGARHARKRGLAAPEPLLRQALPLFDEDGAARQVSVWRYEAPSGSPALLDRVRHALAAIETVAASRPPRSAGRLDLARFLARVETRLAYRETPTAREIRARARAAGAEAALRVESAGRFAWSHGDLHLDNMLWRVHSTPVIVDWESHCLAPLEWDLATLLRSVFVHAPQHPLVEQQRAALLVVADSARFEAAGRPVDWALVEAFARLRNASHASHVLVVGHDPQMLAACQRLDGLLDDGLLDGLLRGSTARSAQAA